MVYPTTLVAGANENVNDLNSNLNAITAWANGSVDATNITNASITADKLATALAVSLGISNAANTGRGATVIASTEGRTNTAYGTLATPDQVTGIVVPTNGLLRVTYQATWQESVDGAARAAIFIGANQLKLAASNVAAPAVQEASVQTAINLDNPLSTYDRGLSTLGGSGGTAYTGDVTTGQIIGDGAFGGGSCVIFVAAGTYTISIQFKASSGTVTAKNRRLYVEAWGP